MAWGMAIAGIASAIGSIAGGLLQSKGSSDAAEAQTAGMGYAADVRKEMFEKQMKLQRPFREAGYEALPDLRAMATGRYDRTATDMMGPEQEGVYNRLAKFTERPLEEDPYYQWRLSEGEDAINKAMAARGLQASRPAINALADQRRALTGEMTQQRYGRLGQQYNMLQGTRANQYNRLSNLANIGQGAATQGVQSAGQFGRGMSNLYGQMGQARAQNALTQGNIYGNMSANLGAMPMNMMAIQALQNQSG